MLKQHFWQPRENRETTWWRHKRKLNMFRKFIIYMISGTNEFIENAMETRRFWRIASFSWISNGTLSHPMLVYMILDQTHKLGCVVGMVVDSILLHAEYGPNGHRKDAPPFIFRDLHNLWNWWEILFSHQEFDYFLIFQNFINCEGPWK